MGQINFSNRGGHGWGESARMEGKSNLNLSFPRTDDQFIARIDVIILSPLSDSGRHTCNKRFCNEKVLSIINPTERCTPETRRNMPVGFNNPILPRIAI